MHEICGYKMNCDKFQVKNYGRMEDGNLNVNLYSVYNLISTLCEKFLSGQKKSSCSKLVRKFKSKAYEILLSKRIPQQVDEFILEDNNDPYCYLLAWQFVLINEYNLPEHAYKLQKCVDALQKSNSLTETALSDVLYILIKLCRLPEQSNVISINCTTSNPLESGMKFRYFDDAKFKLPIPIICGGSRFNNESFLLPTKRNLKCYEVLRAKYSENGICKNCQIPTRVSCTSSDFTVKEDEGYESLPKGDQYDIWELASKTEFNSHRTWETLGNPYPAKEPPFLTESPSGVCSQFYNMHTSNILLLLGEENRTLSKRIEHKKFISHVKDLLVGITSSSFKRDQKGEMYLVPGTTIEGITPLAMESYCKTLIFCSWCYNSLDNLCNFHSPTEDCQRQGFMFKEFCDSIDRYLAYYRLAVQNILENSSLLNVHNYIKPLLSHLDVLACVCKVGPFTESEQLPNGVALLNYLYQKTIELIDKDVIMVLYSILYSCIQVYFNHFLQQWIFEGMINDPYGEFFIVPNSAYIRTRGRTYWTRSYTVSVDMVPDFLGDLSQDILLCGKTMNLLKLCVPSSPLCMYLMGKKPNLLSCCLNSNQISTLERNCCCYYLEVMAECGPKFQLSNVIMKTFKQNMIFMSMITKKRAATIKRLELEKLKKVQEDIEKKRKATVELKKQYDDALQNKKLQLIGEIEREIKSKEEVLKMQNIRQKLIEEEALDLIHYYETLNSLSEKKRMDIQKHIEKLKTIDLDSNTPTSHESPKENVSINTNSSLADEDQVQSLDKLIEERSTSGSNDTFLSADSEPLNEHEQNEENDIDVQAEEKPKIEMHSSKSMDVINANSEGDTKISQVAQIAAENFEIARRNRAKVLGEEMGIIQIETKAKQKSTLSQPNVDLVLSELEKNRLKVMSSEFDHYITTDKVLKKRELSCCEINKQKNMASDECFRGEEIPENKRNLDDEKTFIIPTCYNDNYRNSNANLENNGNVSIVDKEENGNNIEETMTKEMIKVEERNILNKPINGFSKPNNLQLDFSKLTNMQQSKQKSSESIFSRFLKSPNFELDRPIPMSLDSTPCIDLFTPKLQNSIDKEQFEDVESAATNFTDEGFDFNSVVDYKEPLLLTRNLSENSRTRLLKKTDFSKRVSVKDASNIPTRSIKIFIQQSVLIPVNTQIKLVSNEFLKYVFNDLQFLAHLNSLRNYFFLLDGEFGRNITEGLFEKLYDVNFPIDLINCRTLQHLVYNAIESSIKLQENSNCLSFRINSLPKTFNLEDPDVLECLSLTYKVAWPLNILLPSDMIAKYDDVFKFLLKLNRISWVLKKILQEFKLFSKKSGKREAFLVLSPQFQKLHQYRHIMTHFVQTLQNYVVGEVLETSWDAFEKKLVTVSNIDEIYFLHVAYIKNILFMCLLNQRSFPIRKLILKIFTVMLKFHNYLRTVEWTFDDEDCVYEHPNLKKLEDIFQNFEEFVAYFVKAAYKVAKVGYQPHLIQLLDMLNVNDYYTNKNISH